MIAIDEIRSFFRGRITLSEPLGKYTSFQIGGPADYYLEPIDREDCLSLLSFCRQRALPFLIMGKGSNMLVSDDGVKGIVVNMEYGLNRVECSEGVVSADAGVALSRFVEFCIQQRFAGVEMLAGIPGTIGGAVVMNAGAHGGEISDYLLDVDVFRQGTLTTVPKSESRFAYRSSGFQNDVVLGARFRLRPGDQAELMRTRRELLIKRNRTQPINFPNSGSMFKNPPGNYAAKLIEEAGLKGYRYGNAQISDRHANFIVNLGGASALDVLDLVETAQKKVFEKSGIHLELEIKLVGFAHDAIKEVWTQ